MKIAIIGSGYWGVASALMLEDKGHEVTVFDSRTTLSGSINAGGHFSLDWFKGDMKRQMKIAYQDALNFGVEVDTSGSIINTIYDRKKYGKMHFKGKPDWWCFLPEQFLSLREPDLTCRVSKIEDGGRVKLMTPSGLHNEDFDKCIVCAGAWTDVVLAASNMRLTGVYPMPGSAVVLNYKNIDKLTLHQLNPFRQISIRNWGSGKVRVGETTEKLNSNSNEYINKMLGRVSHLTSGSTVNEVFYGYRAMLKNPFVGNVSENVIAATGGGRNGGIMSFWAARKIMEIL